MCPVVCLFPVHKQNVSEIVPPFSSLLWPHGTENRGYYHISLGSPAQAALATPVFSSYSLSSTCFFFFFYFLNRLSTVLIQGFCIWNALIGRECLLQPAAENDPSVLTHSIWRNAGEAWSESLKRSSELSALNVANACFAFEVLWFLKAK